MTSRREWLLWTVATVAVWSAVLAGGRIAPRPKPATLHLPYATSGRLLTTGAAAPVWCLMDGDVTQDKLDACVAAANSRSARYLPAAGAVACRMEER